MSDFAGRFLPVATGAAGLILLHQLIEIQGSVGGVDLAMSSDRMRLLNGVEARLAAFLVADIVLIVACLELGGARAVRALAIAHLAGGALALLAAPLFLADASAMASAVGAGDLAPFRVLALRTAGALAVVGAGTLLAGLRMREGSR